MAVFELDIDDLKNTLKETEQPKQNNQFELNIDDLKNALAVAEQENKANLGTPAAPQGQPLLSSNTPLEQSTLAGQYDIDALQQNNQAQQQQKVSPTQNVSDINALKSEIDLMAKKETPEDIINSWNDKNFDVEKARQEALAKPGMPYADAFVRGGMTGYGNVLSTGAIAADNATERSVPLIKDIANIGRDFTNAKGFQRQKEYSLKDYIPFESDFYTNPEGATYSVAQLLGSSKAFVDILGALGTGAAVTGASWMTSKVAKAIAPAFSKLAEKSPLMASALDKVTGIKKVIADGVNNSGKLGLAGKMILGSSVSAPLDGLINTGDTMEQYLEKNPGDYDGARQAGLRQWVSELPVDLAAAAMGAFSLGKLLNARDVITALKSSSKVYLDFAKEAAKSLGYATLDNAVEAYQEATQDRAVKRGLGKLDALDVYNIADWDDNDWVTAADTFVGGFIPGATARVGNNVIDTAAVATQNKATKKNIENVGGQEAITDSNITNITNEKENNNGISLQEFQNVETEKSQPVELPQDKQAVKGSNNGQETQVKDILATTPADRVKYYTENEEGTPKQLNIQDQAFIDSILANRKNVKQVEDIDGKPAYEFTSKGNKYFATIDMVQPEQQSKQDIFDGLSKQLEKEAKDNGITKPEDIFNYKQSNPEYKKLYDEIVSPTATERKLTRETLDENKVLLYRQQAIHTMRTDSGIPIKFDYELVPSKRLIVSHDHRTFEKNDKFPQDKQPRDRSGATMQKEVVLREQNLDPSRLMGSDMVNTGAPVIDGNNVVLNGNGRTMSIQRVLDANGDNAEKYRQAIVEFFREKYGDKAAEIVRSTLEKAPNTILVRRTYSDYNTEETNSIINSTAEGNKYFATIDMTKAEQQAPVETPEAETPAEQQKVEPTEEQKAGQKVDYWQDAHSSPIDNPTYGRMTTENGNTIAVRYGFTSPDALNVSHDPFTYEPNANYDQRLQQRNRQGIQMKQQVENNAARLNPALLGYSDGVNMGAPVIITDANNVDTVINGNGRAMAIIRAMQTNPENIKAYHEYLIKHAYDYGWTPEQVTQYIAEHPNAILVRQVNEDDNMIQEIAGATGGGMSLSAAEQAARDASKVPDYVWQKYQPNEKGEIDNTSNHEFVDGVLKNITNQNEINEFMPDINGDLSVPGAMRVRNALFAYAYGDKRLISDVANFAGGDNLTSQVVNGLTRAAGDVAKARAAMKANSKEELNFIPKLVEAARTVGRFGRDEQALEKEINSISMFSEEDAGRNIMALDDETKRVLAILFANKGSGANIGKFIKGMANAVIRAAEAETDVFGTDDLPKTITDVIEEGAEVGGIKQTDLGKKGGAENGHDARTGRNAEERDSQEQGGEVSKGSEGESGERKADTAEPGRTPTTTGEVKNQEQLAEAVTTGKLSQKSELENLQDNLDTKDKRINEEPKETTPKNVGDAAKAILLGKADSVLKNSSFKKGGKNFGIDKTSVFNNLVTDGEYTYITNKAMIIGVKAVIDSQKVISEKDGKGKPYRLSGVFDTNDNFKGIRVETAEITKDDISDIKVPYIQIPFASDSYVFNIDYIKIAFNVTGANKFSVKSVGNSSVLLENDKNKELFVLISPIRTGAVSGKIPIVGRATSGVSEYNKAMSGFVIKPATEQWHKELNELFEGNSMRADFDENKNGSIPRFTTAYKGMDGSVTYNGIPYYIDGATIPDRFKSIAKPMSELRKDIEKAYKDEDDKNAEEEAKRQKEIGDYKEVIESYNGFLDGKNDMQIGRVLSVMDKRLIYTKHLISEVGSSPKEVDYSPMTRKEFAEFAVKENLTFKKDSDGYWYSIPDQNGKPSGIVSKITKLEYDYYEFLKGKRDAITELKETTQKSGSFNTKKTFADELGIPYTKAEGEDTVTLTPETAKKLAQNNYISRAEVPKLGATNQQVYDALDGAIKSKAEVLFQKTRQGKYVLQWRNGENEQTNQVMLDIEGKQDFTEQPQAKTNIQDFGEYIGGARKHLSIKSDTTKPKQTKEKTDSDLPKYMKNWSVLDQSFVQFTDDGKKFAIMYNPPKGHKIPYAFRFAIHKGYDTKEQALNAIRAAIFADGYRYIQEGDKVAIAKHVAEGKYWVIKDGFDTRDDAQRYTVEHFDEILGTNTFYGESDIVSPLIESWRDARTGNFKDRLQGKNATEQMFVDDFGFRGVQFGNWNNQQERQELMNAAYEGLHDLADLLDLPSKAISLGGELGLAFGARGHGLSGAKAHYEPQATVINLTKMKGAGSLAHEWSHAVDHYLLMKGGLIPTTRDKNGWLNSSSFWLTAHASDALGRDLHSSTLSKPVQDSFIKLMKTIMYKEEVVDKDIAKIYRVLNANKEALNKALNNLREHVANERKWGKKKAPATQEQLAAFDAAAAKVMKADEEHILYKSPNASYGYWTYPSILELGNVVKTITGRGFTQNDSTSGNLIAYTRVIQRYNNELKEAEKESTEIKTIPTDYKVMSTVLDSGRSTDYWTKPTEMLSRAFSSYIEDKAAEKGYTSSFLSYGSDNNFYMFGMPYPEKAERKAINEAMDAFYKAIANEVKTPVKETDNVSYAMADNIKAEETRQQQELANKEEEIQATILGEGEYTSGRVFNDVVNEAKEAFKGADIVPNKDNKTFTIKFKNGQNVTLDIVDEIVATPEDMERYKAAHGKLPKAIKAVTKTKLTKAGLQAIVQVSTKNSQYGDLFHESFHIAAKLFLSGKQYNSLMDYFDKTRGSSQATPEELAADGYKAWRKAREERRGTLWGKLYQKVLDGCNAVLGLFNTKKRLVNNIFKQMESGELFNGKVNNAKDSVSFTGIDDNKNEALASVVSSPARTGWKGAYDKGGVTGVIKHVYDELYTDWVDKFHPIDNIDKDTNAKKGEKLLDRVHMVGALTSGFTNTLIDGNEKSIKVVEEQINAKLHNVTFKDVLSVIDPKEMDKLYPNYLAQFGEGKDWHEMFGTYLVWRRLAEMSKLHDQAYIQEYKEWQKKVEAEKYWAENDGSEATRPEPPGVEPKYKPYKLPNNLTEEDLLNGIEQAPGEFERAANLFYLWNDNILTILERGNIISPDTHKLLNTKYKNYCSLMRDFSEEGAFSDYLSGLNNGGKGIANVKTTLKRISEEGSERLVLNPLEVAVKACAIAVNRAERNKVAMFAVDKLEQSGYGLIVPVKGEAHPDPGRCIFTVMFEGKPKAYKCVPELYEPITLMDKNSSGIVMEAMSAAARTLRTGATISPSFTIRNFARDTMQAGISSSNGFKPIIDSIRGAWELANNKDLAAEFQALGVSSFNFYTHRDAIQKTIRDLAPKRNAVTWQDAKDIFMRAFGMEDFSAFVEASTRAGEYYLARKHGKSMLEAALDARRVTIDFARSGRLGQQVNRVIPFFNATIQGTDINARLVGSGIKAAYNIATGNKQEGDLQKLRIFAKLLCYAVIPALILRALVDDEPWYDELDPRIKYSNWVLPNKVVVPMSQEWGLYASLALATMDNIQKNDKKAYENWRQLVRETIAPNVLPTMILPIIEGLANYSFWTGKPLANQRLMKLPPEQRAYASTSELSKWFGKQTGIAPVIIDNTIRGYTGTMGSLTWGVAGNTIYAMAGKEQNKPAKSWSEQPLIRDFAVNDNKLRRYTDEFMNISKEAEQRKDEYRPYMKGINSLNRKITDLYKMNRGIDEGKIYPKHSPGFKKQLKDRNFKKIRQLSKRGVELYGDKIKH